MYSLLESAEEFKKELGEGSVVELAIWFHDVIYVPGSAVNERESARLFEDVVYSKLRHCLDYSKLTKKNLRSIVAYIIATENHTAIDTASDQDLEFFLDFDLSVLGANWEEYSEYTSNIRKEYIMYPYSFYAKKRKEFLKCIAECKNSPFKTKEF